MLCTVPVFNPMDSINQEFVRLDIGGWLVHYSFGFGPYRRNPSSCAIVVSLVPYGQRNDDVFNKVVEYIVLRTVDGV